MRSVEKNVKYAIDIPTYIVGTYTISCNNK